MSFIGAKPTAVPLTVSDLQNDIINADKISDNSISDEHLDVTSITGQTSQGSPADGDEILVHDTSASALRRFTRSDFLTGVGGSNTPYFSVTKNNQTVNSGSSTKILWETENVDTNNNFASSRFTPTTAGYYFFSVILGGAQNDDAHVLTIKKNGNDNYLFDGDVTDGYAINGTITLQANGSGDYFEVYFHHAGGSGKNVTGVSRWSGFKLIGS